jgi:glycine/D-amino acid oxidase-like deaminating enzyme
MRVEIAVIGGGVNGLAIARELAARHGADVAVFDDRRLGAASRAAAGLLGAQTEAADLPRALRSKAFPVLRESRLSLARVPRPVATRGSGAPSHRGTSLARSVIV